MTRRFAFGLMMAAAFVALAVIPDRPVPSAQGPPTLQQSVPAPSVWMPPVKVEAPVAPKPEKVHHPRIYFATDVQPEFCAGEVSGPQACVSRPSRCPEHEGDTGPPLT